MHLVYILHSEKLDRFYIGYTIDLGTRLAFHQNPETRKFTYNAKDWEVFLTIECQSKRQALAIEKHIKKMKSKTYIQNLVRYTEIIEKLLNKYKDQP